MSPKFFISSNPQSRKKILAQEYFIGFCVFKMFMCKIECKAVLKSKMTDRTERIVPSPFFRRKNRPLPPVREGYKESLRQVTTEKRVCSLIRKWGQRAKRSLIKLEVDTGAAASETKHKGRPYIQKMLEIFNDARIFSRQDQQAFYQLAQFLSKSLSKVLVF